MKETLLRNPAQIIRSTDFPPVSGIVNTAIKRGVMVNLKADATLHTPVLNGLAPNFELVLADTTAPAAAVRQRKVYFLDRTVLSANDLKTHQETEMRYTPEEAALKLGLIQPVGVGQCVSASEVLEIEVEGTDFLHASVTGTLVVGVQLTLVAGKWALKTVVDGETAGRIVANIAPIIAGNFRYRIEIAA